MSEFEDAFDRVKIFLDDKEFRPDNLICVGWKSSLLESDLRLVVGRLDEMIQKQRREALSEMAERDADLILKGY